MVVLIGTGCSNAPSATGTAGPAAARTPSLGRRWCQLNSNLHTLGYEVGAGIDPVDNGLTSKTEKGLESSSTTRASRRHGGVVGVLTGAAATALYANSKGRAFVIPAGAWSGGIASAILIGVSESTVC